MTSTQEDFEAIMVAFSRGDIDKDGVYFVLIQSILEALVGIGQELLNFNNMYAERNHLETDND